MDEASFEVTVNEADIAAFCKISGDFNPLHADAAYAAKTPYGRRVLHGAFSAGLISRLAGMHLPGRECLLRSMKLRFVAPIVPPVTLRVSGRLAVPETKGIGRVDVVIRDVATGTRHVEASYEYDRHDTAPLRRAGETDRPKGDGATILITGAAGGLGSAVRARLGTAAVAVPRHAKAADIEGILGERAVKAIVHCGWPRPDNEWLTEIEDADAPVETHLASPARDIITLARTLSRKGQPGALLLLVGSTFSEPGRHGYRMPLYSIAKSMLPAFARALAVELAPTNHRVAVVSFDVIDGGMNSALGKASKIMHEDRSPFGRLANPVEAAEQIAWVLDNPGIFISGAALTLSGGALP